MALARLVARITPALSNPAEFDLATSMQAFAPYRDFQLQRADQVGSLEQDT